MNRPEINISDAINIAVRYAGFENDEPCCVSAVYEGDFFALTVYTVFQKYEFYVHGTSGEVTGMISEPILCFEDERCRICA